MLTHFPARVSVTCFLGVTPFARMSMCSTVGQVIHAPDSHTGEVIKDMVSASLEEWGLRPANLMALTTDNASNNKRACQLASKYTSATI